MKCQACRHENADRALFCAACRRPLVAPAQVPTRMEPLSPPVAPAMAASYGGGATGGAAAAPSDAGARNRYAPPAEVDERRDGRIRDEGAVMTDQEAWAAVIGDRNTAYYLERFERQARGGSALWHWPALFVTWYWMLYRKLWVPALVYFFAPSFAFGIIAAVLPPAVLIVAYIGFIVAPPMLANGLYYRHCLSKIRDTRARGGSKEQMLARLEANGGTSNVRQQYEQTGTLPSSSDLNLMVSRSTHQKYLAGAGIDPSSGLLTFKVELSPYTKGTFEMVPSADANKHLSWTCTTEDEKFAKLLPRACRGEAQSR